MNVTAKDIFGRTPLFYAVTKSLELASVLIEKGANLHSKDNCNVSILSFFIENCILNKYDGCLTHMEDTLTFFMENGVKRKKIFKTIISVVFCQILRVLMKYNMFRNREQPAKTLESLCEVLKSAKDYAKENKKREITDLIDEILQQTRNSRTIDRLGRVTPNILEMLIKLGANPTSADSKGNTAIHFLTQLSVHSSVSQETVHDILTKLEASEKLGNFRKLENHQQETPFVHMIYVTLNDRSAYGSGHCPLPNIATVYSVCKFLLKHGSSVEETSRTGRTAFHWILRLISQVLLRSDGQERKKALATLMQMFDLFASPNITEGVTVNQKDAGDNLNTPLHLLASLQLRPGEDYSSSVADGFTFKSIFDKIVRFLLKCGAQVGSRNKDDETPLHLCRTWTAVKLLLEAGANPDDLDSSGCPPLIAVARKMTFDEDSNNFYPDLLLNPKELWETILKSGMNPWFVDENGDSILSIFMKSKALVLTKALVEVACEKTLDLKETILKSILNSICKDESIVTTWKSDLVKVILKSQKGGSILKPSETSPLHNCCRNIMSLEKAKSLHGRKPEPSKLREYSRLKKATSVDSTSRKQEGMKLDKDNVHWTIAKLLLQYGADCTVPDVTGQCCMDIAEDCPALKKLLRKDIPWISVSEKHKLRLSRAAKLQECCHVDQYFYHQRPVNRGSFSDVYAGINEKDGREVAIKRIKLPMNQSDKREVLKQEIATLTALERFEQVVGYFDSFEDETFVYVVLELMEGNLEEYLDSPGFDVSISVKLCQDVLTGLNFLHSQEILHQDLKPTNILYKEYPTLCLKIAGFGVSYHVNCSSTVNDSGVGARCWIAPEVLRDTKYQHSPASDMFSCGLVLHYILSAKKHPFAPAVCANKSAMQIIHETESNVMNDNMEGWDDTLCPEAAQLFKAMLDGDKKKRPSAGQALDHPFFWTKGKKLDLLTAVGNQPEIKCPCAKSSDCSRD